MAFILKPPTRNVFAAVVETTAGSDGTPVWKYGNAPFTSKGADVLAPVIASAYTVVKFALVGVTVITSLARALVAFAHHNSMLAPDADERDLNVKAPTVDPLIPVIGPAFVAAVMIIISLGLLVDIVTGVVALDVLFSAPGPSIERGIAPLGAASGNHPVPVNQTRLKSATKREKSFFIGDSQIC